MGPIVYLGHSDLILKLVKHMFFSIRVVVPLVFIFWVLIGLPIFLALGKYQGLLIGGP